MLTSIELTIFFFKNCLINIIDILICEMLFENGKFSSFSYTGLFCSSNAGRYQWDSTLLQSTGMNLNGNQNNQNIS
jgi:hypothetical protein